jgi:hypothetical protein
MGQAEKYCKPLKVKVVPVSFLIEGNDPVPFASFLCVPEDKKK